MSADRGSVRWHRNGWEVRVQLAGRRVTRRVKAANTRAGRREAEKALDALLVSTDDGSNGMTVARVLDRYAALKSGGWAPSTVATHRFLVAPLLVEFGDVEASALTRAMIEGVYGRWVAGGLSVATVRRRNTVLAAAMRQAERWGVIAVSPVRDVEIPAGGRRAGEDLPEFGDVLAAIRRLGHRRLEVAAWLAVVTGCRRGELVGLRWRDVNLDDGQVSVRGAMSVGPDGPVRSSTKSGGSKVISLDAVTVRMLGEWRSEVVAEGLRVGHAVGALSPVLPSPSDPSVPWHPGQVSLQWRRHRDGVGLGGVKFHGLRHLQATFLIAQGVPVTVVAERLGHSSTRMTLDVYGHAAPAGDRAAAALIEAATRAI